MGKTSQLKEPPCGGFAFVANFATLSTDVEGGKMEKKRPSRERKPAWYSVAIRFFIMKDIPRCNAVIVSVKAKNKNEARGKAFLIFHEMHYRPDVELFVDEGGTVIFPWDADARPFPKDVNDVFNAVFQALPEQASGEEKSDGKHDAVIVPFGKSTTPARPDKEPDGEGGPKTEGDPPSESGGAEPKKE